MLVLHVLLVIMVILIILIFQNVLVMKANIRLVGVKKDNAFVHNLFLIIQ